MRSCAPFATFSNGSGLPGSGVVRASAGFSLGSDATLVQGGGRRWAWDHGSVGAGRSSGRQYKSPNAPPHAVSTSATSTARNHLA